MTKRRQGTQAQNPPGRRIQRRFAGPLLPVLLAMALGGCASIAPGGRPQFTAPTAISSLYSSFDMNMRLAATDRIEKGCEGVQCRVDQGFERQVARIGTRLTQAAYELDPELKERVPEFRFLVAEKSEAGSTSDASGTIVIYRGVRQAPLDEEALAFLIAREMGHVIARHHDEKSATTIMLAIVAQILLPMTSLTNGVAALTGSLASAVGTKMISADKRAEQAVEADAIAHDLLARQGWNTPDVAASVANFTRRLDDGPWARAVRDSLARTEPVDASIGLVAMEQAMESATR